MKTPPVVLLVLLSAVLLAGLFWFSLSSPSSPSSSLASERSGDPAKERSSTPISSPAGNEARKDRGGFETTDVASSSLPPHATRTDPQPSHREASPIRSSAPDPAGGDPATVGPWADGAALGVAVDGEPAFAEASVGGRVFSLSPNQAGSFQRVHVAPASSIQVRLKYPQATERESVTAQTTDGGTVNGKTGTSFRLDAQGEGVFTVAVSDEAGIHSVLLRKGGDLKVLEFWVGPPYPIRTDHFSAQHSE